LPEVPCYNQDGARLLASVGSWDDDGKLLQRRWEPATRRCYNIAGMRRRCDWLVWPCGRPTIEGGGGCCDS
ncbi:hypothetical protein PIB30_082611, partial [Stylosanthes scabra]|nr:hypothetical protein [Stylosanthes scabra]